jgi:hypothetical protein
MIASGCAIAWKGEVMRSRSRKGLSHSDIKILGFAAKSIARMLRPYTFKTALLH